MVVAKGATGLCHIGHAAAVSTLNVIAEGEEGVGPQGHTGVLSDPSAFFFRGERRGTLGEELLPCTFGQYIVGIFRM